MRKYYLSFMFLMLVLAMFLVVGCGARFVDDAHKTLSISKETYDSSLTVAGDLYKQNHITEEQKDRVIEYGTHYMIVHNEAVSTLLEYELTKDEDAKDRYFQTVKDVLSRLSFLTDYVRSIGGNDELE